MHTDILSNNTDVTRYEQIVLCNSYSAIQWKNITGHLATRTIFLKTDIQSLGGTCPILTAYHSEI
jgi:hypothetical protein